MNVFPTNHSRFLFLFLFQKEVTSRRDRLRMSRLDPIESVQSPQWKKLGLNSNVSIRILRDSPS